jgi:hypothetical protein
MTIDPFVILTPILLLGVVALLGFVGCDLVLGFNHYHEEPKNLHAVAGNGKVTLSWDPSSDALTAPDADKYKVYVSGGVTARGPFLVKTSEFVDSSLVNGTTYHYGLSQLTTDGEDSQIDEHVDATPIGITEAGVNGAQRAQRTTGAVDSTTLAFPGPVAANNLLLVGGAVYRPAGAVSAPTITDTLGTPYTVVSGLVPDTNASVRAWMAYGVVADSGSNSVAVSNGGETVLYSFSIDEFSGVLTGAPLDVDGGFSAGNGLTAASPITTSVPNDLIVAALASNMGSVGDMLALDTAWTGIGQDDGTIGNQAYGLAFQLVTDAQPYAATWTITPARSWAVYTLAIKSAP